MIYHLTTAAEWKEAQENGIYVAPSLETEGFIHCSTEDQVPGVAKRFFAGKKGLVLLHIDERALDAELKFEPASDASGEFPHIYGPINLEAVIKAEPFTAPPKGEPKAATCDSCGKPRATLECGLCHGSLCKSCDQFLEKTTFDFRETIPEELSHLHYCPACHEEVVQPAQAEYEELMEQAKGAYFFYKTQKRQLPILKRAQHPVKIEGVDRNEVILRLAFRAVEQGFNCVIEGEVEAEKIRNEGYQKSLWRGVGVPATVDSEKLERRSEGKRMHYGNDDEFDA